MLRFYKLSAVAMALTVALTACTEGTGLNDDDTGLNDEPFAPAASAADLQVVQGAFAASVFESLALSSEDFNLVPDPPPPAVALLQASVAAASAGSHWEAAAAAEAFAAAGPASGPLLPVDFRGRTYDRGVDGYRHNLERTDAPVNGVRFILYEVDPATHIPGTTEIGYVDLLDESTDLAYVARVVVVTGGVVRINYTVSAVVGTQTLGFTVSGFIGDGTNQIDVYLSMTFVHALPVSTATVEHRISVPSRGFEVNATVVFEFNDETLQGSADVNATFMQSHHTVTVTGVMTFSEGDLPTEAGSFEIHVDGQLFATVTVDVTANGETITVQNATGGELTSTEAQHVRTIFHGLEEMFDDKFEDFIRPVAWLFGAGAAA